jgi:N-acetylglucosaminyldiphosphoundecaprenol N-acetyl-beta-D-mannosaminyltransferase
MSRKVTILGVPVHNRTSAESVHIISTWLSGDADRLKHVVTVNPEFIMMARRNAEFQSVLERADLSTADGVGILIAAKILGSPIRERITGVELTEEIAAMNPARARLYLLGSAPGVAAEAGNRLKMRFPNVQIVGAFSGGPEPADFEEIARRIGETGANTLLVAFGAPQQDLWISRYRQELAACGIVVAIGVGGTFDYLSGRVPRAPGLVRRIGLEWLYRLIRQPWRWRRQLALPQFAALVLWDRLTGKGNRSVSNNGSTQR